MFIHEDPDFLNLIGIVAGKRGLALAIVEKDYWVTHALWSLGNAGFDVWFKVGIGARASRLMNAGASSAIG